MKLLSDQTDELSLSHLGEEAIRLVGIRDFQGLADRFGYALAFGREPAAAIEADFNADLPVEESAPVFTPSTPHSVTIKYFNPDEPCFFALIQCVVPRPDKVPVLVDLIITKVGEDKHASLEGVTPCA